MATSKKDKANYSELVNFRLPATRWKRVMEKVYPVEIIEWQSDRVKVHYVGFDNCYDKWKHENEVEVLGLSSVDTDMPEN